MMEGALTLCAVYMSYTDRTTVQWTVLDMEHARGRTRTVGRNCALELTRGSRVVDAVVFDDVILNKRVRRPSVDGKVRVHACAIP